MVLVAAEALLYWTADSDKTLLVVALLYRIADWDETADVVEDAAIVHNYDE